MIKAIDQFLNRITMYRLVSYYLVFLLVAALIMDFTGIQSYDPFALLFSTAFLLVVSLFTNWVFSKVFRIPVNVEFVLHHCPDSGVDHFTDPILQ